MTPKFSGLVLPIFKLVLDLLDRIDSGQQVDIQTERNLLRDEITDAEKTVASLSPAVRPEDFELAKRALIYWTDEVLTEALPSWQDRVLEVEYFGPPKSRAWKFYVDGESQARHASPDVAETWYLALVLGFQGDIRDAFRNHLKREVPGNAEIMETARQDWGRQLERRIHDAMPGDIPPEPLVGNVGRLNGDSVLTVAAVTCGLLLVSLVGLLIVYLAGGPTSDW